MTTNAWRPPKHAPAKGRLDRERDVLWLPDSLGLTVKPVASPVVGGQVKPWVRPSAAACFPLHPAAVIELYARAVALLFPMLPELNFAEADRDRLRQQCWAAATALYAAGQPVRTALDEFVTGRKYQPSLTGYDGQARLAAQRTGLLAAWAVARAAVEWAGEAE